MEGQLQLCSAPISSSPPAPQPREGSHTRILPSWRDPGSGQHHEYLPSTSLGVFAETAIPGASDGL